MGYNTKYTATFKDVNNKPYRLDIDELNYIGNSTTVTLASSPVVSYPEIKKGYDWLFTSGIEFSLLSTVDRQFIDMFTNEMQKYRVTLNANGAKVWSGFLDVETYSEDFNKYSNYSVNFTGNDGFKLLERYSYVNNAGANYTGITSVWQVIVNCLSKVSFNQYELHTNINLQTGISVVNNEYFDTGCTFNPLDDYTVLSKLFVQNENFYDEENKPLNCYDVLKNVLQTFQLYLFQDPTQCNLYLVDDITYQLSGASTQYFKGYSLVDYSIVSAPKIPFYQVGINTNDDSYYHISINSNSSQIEKIAGVNSQKFNYNQYAKDVILNYSTTPTEFSGLTGTTNFSTSNANYKWREKNYSGSTIWNKTNKGCFCKYEGYGTANTGKTDYYCKILPDLFYSNYHETVFSLKTKLPRLNWESGKYYLKLEMKAYFRTKDNPDDNDEVGLTINNGTWGVFIIVGDKKYCDSGYLTPAWRDAVGYSTALFNLNFWGSNKRDISVCDNYINNSTLINPYIDMLPYQLIPLTKDLYGDLTIEIPNNLYLFNKTVVFDRLLPLPIVYHFVDTDATYNVKDVRFKSFKATIVDELGNSIYLGNVLYDGAFDARYETKGKEIEYLIGTNVNQLPCSRASLYVDSTYFGTTDKKYIYLDKVIKGRIDYDEGLDELFIVDGTNDIIEHHNMKTILNQYSGLSYQLTISTTILPFMLTTVDYPTYLPNKKFMITGLKVDYAKDINELKLIEIKKIT